MNSVLPAMQAKWIFVVLCLVLAQYRSFSQSSIEEPTGREMLQRRALVRKGSDAVKEEDLVTADSLFTRALKMWGDEEAFLRRAETRRLMGNRAGFCSDLKSGGYGDLRSVFERECQRRDSLSFNLSGLNPERFIGIKNVTRALDLADGRTYIRLYDERDTLRAVFFTSGDDTLFLKCDTMAWLGNGEGGIFDYLKMNVKYPQKALDAGISGVVFVGFTIRRDGGINDLRVLRPAHPLLDAEAIRVVQGMENWRPGRYCGRPIDCTFSLPVKFSLR